MARRRRRRHYRGTPGEHRTKARMAARELHAKIAVLRRAVKAGHCERALTHLAHAQTELGELRAEGYWARAAPRRGGIGGAWRALQSARHSFAVKCVR